MTGDAFVTADGGSPRDHLLMDVKLVARLREQLTVHVDCSLDAPLGADLRKQLSIGFERTW